MLTFVDKLINIKNMENFTIKKSIYKDVETKYSIDSYNEFYGKFYNSSNCIVYIGGFIKDKKSFYIQKQDIYYSIEIRDIVNGGRDSLRLEIERSYRDFEFKNNITKSEFLDKISDFKYMLDL